MTYSLITDRLGHTSIVRDSDHASIPADPLNRDYQEYQAWLARGNHATPAPPVPDPEPTRDERLAQALEAAHADVQATIASAHASLLAKGVATPVADVMAQALGGVADAFGQRIGEAIRADQP